MKRHLLILIFFIFHFSILNSAWAWEQQFIGCRTDSGWAETPMLRKTFYLPDSLFKADHWFKLWIRSLGYHEAYINGVKVGDYVMQPAVSQLDKRSLVVTYDVTPYLHEGQNELLLWLGQGWGRIYGTPAVAWSMVEWTDGSQWNHYALTDSTWEASPSGYSYTGSWQPMHFGGERYDARVKPQWRPATVTEVTGDADWQWFEGNRIVDFLSPISETPQPDGSILLDFGRVVTGWFQVTFLPKPEGHEITMEYLDHLDAKPPFTETDIYVSDGTGDDDIHFTNRFHMHAFRYVRIRGVDTANMGTPISEYQYATALQISAVDPKEGATFECSDPRLNAIHDMVKYTLSCLTFSGYMVDCPHIERMGYGGDGNSSTMTLQTLWDVRDTYRNWLTAWADAMDSTGDLPYVAPAFRTGGGPYWSGFIIKAPWRTYLNYGDRSLIYLHYDDMKRWLEYIEQHSEDYILQPWPDNERHSWFLGDWAVPEGVDKGGESVLHASSCFISDCLADMIQMARMTGHPDDARHYAEWRQNLNAAIHRHFYHPETHTYANGTPLDQCYALLQGIPPDSATAAAVKAQMLKDCHGKYRDHIAVGLVGVPIFTEWCIRERQADLMATILRQPDYPGYLNMINNGATTTWESWDCGRPGKEDRSRVHNCYNGIGIWFYQALAGIRPDLHESREESKHVRSSEVEWSERSYPEQPGYKHFFIDPQPCDGIDWVRCTKPTQYGDIKVEVKSEKLKVKSVKLIIPTGTTATVYPGSRYERTVGPGEYIIPLYQ